MDLLDFYTQIVRTCGPVSGIVGKIALGCVLLILGLGNKKIGGQLLPLMAGAQLLTAGWLAWSTGTAANVPTNAGGGIVGVAVLCLVAGLALGISAFVPEGQWRVLAPKGWRRWTGLALIAWGFYMPVFQAGWIKPLWASPVGILPHSTLLVLAAIAWSSIPNTPRLAGWTLAIACVALGVSDMVVGLKASAVLLLMGGVLIVELGRMTMQAGGVLQEDIAPIDRELQSKREKEYKEKTAPEKRWKLK